LAPADGIKVTGARPEISGRPVGSLLYTLLQNAVRAVLAALVLCRIVAASFSTADGAIPGTAAVFARNVLNIREEFD
jgi:Na+/proline symporter